MFKSLQYNTLNVMLQKYNVNHVKFETALYGICLFIHSKHWVYNRSVNLRRHWSHCLFTYLYWNPFCHRVVLQTYR